MPAPLDPFIPAPDVRERHSVLVRAPAALVFDVARHFDMASLPLVQTTFRLRGLLLHAKTPTRREPADPDALLRMGWGRLTEEPGRLFAAGAVCRPWLADVSFTPVDASHFAAYAEPDLVKIAWTFETEALGTALTRLATETRAVATDAGARRAFRRYWRWARIGIVGIRWLLLPAIRREAQDRYRVRST